MIDQLIVSTLMVTLTVAIHATGLVLLARLFQFESREERAAHVSPASLRGIAATVAIVLALFALHGVEIWLYSLLYLGLGAIATLEGAVYFSTITYGAVGYSDHAMAHEWRLVSAIEGINGILLIGWSTAFFIATITRMRRPRG